MACAHLHTYLFTREHTLRGQLEHRCGAQPAGSNTWSPPWGRRGCLGRVRPALSVVSWAAGCPSPLPAVGASYTFHQPEPGPGPGRDPLPGLSSRPWVTLNEARCSPWFLCVDFLAPTSMGFRAMRSTQPRPGPVATMALTSWVSHPQPRSAVDFRWPGRGALGLPGQGSWLRGEPDPTSLLWAAAPTTDLTAVLWTEPSVLVAGPQSLPTAVSRSRSFSQGGLSPASPSSHCLGMHAPLLYLGNSVMDPIFPASVSSWILVSPQIPAPPRASGWYWFRSLCGS